MYKLFVYTSLCLALFCSTSWADTEHRVRKGETLTEIAQAYKVTVKQIEDANNLRNADQIRIGQTLKIPAAKPQYIEYKIRRGDSLSELAKQYGTTLRQLSSYNNIRNPNKIRVGQVVRIPISGSSVSAEMLHPQLDAQLVKQLASIRTKSNQWKHIVIHHSGTRVGSAKGMDRFHREERRMENGLAYHFVIGNGNGMGDGEVHVGDRWKHQLQGGHLSSYALNQVSIGICLVGDFQKTQPTRRQMDQLEALVTYLMGRSNIPASRVTTHTLIHPKHTLCPGKNFPMASLKKAISR